MARKTKKDALLLQQDAAAPYLFDEEHLPHAPALVQAVKDKRYEVTGARLLDDDDKCLRLVELLCHHPPIGLRKIAKALGVSRDTVRAARQALVDQGKLRPYKERVVALLEDIIETGAASYLDDLESGRVSAATKPLAIGIFTDKRALALGEPTAISVGATTRLPPEALSVKKLNEWAESLPIEGESSGPKAIPQQTGDPKPVATALDAALVPPAVDPPPA